jgi:biotin transport system substrate-specific component
MNDRTLQPTLAARLWPQAADGLLQQAMLVLAGSLLLAASARVQVPFWPVPMTMQTFVVLGIGAACGARLAGATLATYLAQGALGLPVFASGAGLAYMAGPTGGYLLGFLLAAILMGWLADRGACRTPGSTAACYLAGLAVIYGLGAGWLAALFGPQVALASGIAPFALAEAVKLGLAVLALPALWRLGGR